MFRALLVGLLVGTAGWYFGRHLGKSASVDLAPVPVLIRGGDVSRDEQPPSESKPSDLRSAATSLVSPKDFARFFELSQRLPLSEFAATIERLGTEGWGRDMLFQIWVERDLDAARQWFETRASDDRKRLFRSLASVWVQLDADGFRRWLISRSEVERRDLQKLQVDSVVEPLTALDPQSALELAKLYPDLLSAPGIIAAWAEKDPYAAAAKALELEGSEKSTAANFLMRKWGWRDPKEAMDWIDALEDPGLATSARDGLLMAIARNDPAAGLEIVRTRFPENDRSANWRYVAAYGAGEDPESVVRIALSEGDPEIRRTLLSEALRFMTSNDAGVKGGVWPPAETSAATDSNRAADLWLQESTTSGKPLPYLDEIAAALAKRNGVKAAIDFLDRIPVELNADVADVPDWLSQVRDWGEIGSAAIDMEEGLRRSSWLEKAVSGLAERGDTAQAQLLIERIPAGPERIQTIRTMAGAEFRDNPTLAAEHLLSLPDGRAELMQGLAQWLQRKPREAEPWIRTSQMLAPAEAAQLLSARLGGKRP